MRTIDPATYEGDIVSRLRNWRGLHLAHGGELFDEAANEIARLRLTLRNLLERLKRPTLCEQATDMTDIATRLRQTRADMIGTDDENHYWDCHDAAAEIDRLREATLRLADQDATLSVSGGNVTVTLDATLTDEEREAIEWYAGYGREGLHAATLRSLLERLT